MTFSQLTVIIITVFLSACAQLLFKLGMDKAAPDGSLFNNGMPFLFRALSSTLVLSGILIYGISIIVWLWVLSKVDLSIAYPFVGISFIFTLVFGVLFLGEPLNLNKIIGTCMIIGGCAFIAKSA